MIIALHGPDFITFLAKGLPGICANPYIDKDWYRIRIENETAYIIVVMAFIVISSLACNEETVLMIHVAELCFWIKRVGR